ncbi:MAG: oligosaccharide flippase family protein [Ginsengibacter sp.]
MKRKFIRDLSVNTFQVIINQVSGLVIFYILSAYFSKNIFGEINWSLAILLAVFSILSLGIDQVAVKKIAAGKNPHSILSIYFTHVLIAGGLFYIFLLACFFIFPHILQNHFLLLFLGIGKLMIFLSTPFKQLANGLEKFRALLYMSVCSNVARSSFLILYSLFAKPELATVIIIFIVGDSAELLVSFLITKKFIRIPVSVKLNKIEYLNLIKESMPQVGVVIFTSAIARFDWIILGILSSNIIVAEYSFAFKAFELATLPLLVIAPILIPSFTRLFDSHLIKLTKEKSNDLFTLLRFEMIISSLVALMLNVLWVPVIDFITDHKYGAKNHYTILLLSICMPLIYANNFLWTINFAKGKLKSIFYIFFFTFLSNVICDIILIPFFGGEGAAVGYLLAIGIQFGLFWLKTDLPELGKNIYPVFLCPIISFISGALAIHFFDNIIITFPMSIFFFFIITILARQLRYTDFQILRRLSGI